MGCCCSSSTYLTTKGTEAEGVQQAALTRLAGIGNSFGRPGLRPFIQKHHARAVDDVSLDACDIQHLLNLRDSNHIVVRRTSNLHNMVVLVLRQAKGANAAGASAFQTKEIAFAFVRDSVDPTRGKELRRQQWLQPSRLLSLWMILAVVSFDPYRTAHGFNSSSLGRRARSLLWLHRLDRQRGVFLCLRHQNLQSDICCSDISNCVQVHKAKRYPQREALVCYTD
jgi:hypothetical protein